MVLGPRSREISQCLLGLSLCPFLFDCGSCCFMEKMGLCEAGIVFFYYWNKAGRMIFGVFGDAIDELGVRFGGNHFFWESRLSHAQVISVVSGVPMNSL